MYTTVTFMPKNSLPSTGSIKLVFSGVDIKSTIWFYDDDASAAATPPDSLS